MIARAFGFSIIPALYIAVALTFSSTIIIMKLLSDKGDLETLYGKISIGFLIVQDIIAVLILMAISSFSGHAGGLTVLEGLLAGILMIGALTMLSIFILPSIIARVAKSQEFLLLFSLGWALMIASIFHAINFSLEIGALLAGVTLSLSPYRYEIAAKMQPLRDFFVVLFFVLLGTQMTFSHLLEFFWPALAFSLFVLIGNPLIVIAIMSALGYTRRTSFRAGLTVAQISEFSLIIIALAVSVGQVGPELLTLVTLIGITTIAVSSYLIMYAERIYPRVEPLLRIFGRRRKKAGASAEREIPNAEALLIGYNRIGYDILRALKRMRATVLVIDYNPATIKLLQEQKIPCLYGDAADPELLADLNFSAIKMIISTIPNPHTNTLLIRETRRHNPNILIVVTAHQIAQAQELYRAGAAYVIMPHFLGGRHVAEVVRQFRFRKQKFAGLRRAHRAYLEERALAGHEHPPNHPHGR